MIYLYKSDITNTVMKLGDSTKKVLTLFLQVGKQVKKVFYDGDISIPALRMLFIEKFEYNPGLDDFPNIYIKDSKLDLLYELENLDEVKDNSVLALNIESKIVLLPNI